MAKRTCSVKDCDRPARKRGWCEAHYHRWKQTGDVGAAVPLAPRNSRAPGSRCVVEDCDRSATDLGWCRAHYERRRRTGDVDAAVPIRAWRTPGALCVIDGCEKPRSARGWCDTHYARWRRHGDPLVAKAETARRHGEPVPVRRSVIPGERYGKLAVVCEIPGIGKRRVECVCDCGTVKTMLLGNLVPGTTGSCGCVGSAKTIARNKSAEHRALITKHGLWQHPLLGTWRGMMARCYDPKHHAFKNYGGRGITVCDSWHDPRTFVAWIEQNLGSRPEGMTLDRWPDNDSGYGPGNVRWATRSQQGQNRRPDTGMKGSATPASVLTEDIVRECRVRCAAGETQLDLATEFRVSKPTMHKAIVGKTWRHV